MKNILSVLLLLLNYYLVVGQTEPIEHVEVEPDPFVMDSYDYATGLMNNVPWMFKLTLDGGPTVGFEYKVKNALSLNANIKWIAIAINDNPFARSNISVRYYLDHDKRIKRNQQGNNFNGIYSEFGAEIDIANILSLYENPFVSLGLQSRFLKHGLIDAGLKMGVNTRQRSISITSGFDLGLAFSKNYELDKLEENKCAIVRCFDEQFYMFKTQISRLLNLTISRDFFDLRFEPNFELEHRISRVGLSMNHEFLINLRRRKNDNLPAYDFSINDFGFRSGIRWYVGKKRRIIKGKTSNNLSGFYLGPIGEIGKLSGRYRGLVLNNGEYWGAGFNLGFQTRLLRQLYLKFDFGLLYREYFNQNNPLKISIFTTSDSDYFKITIDDHIEIAPIGGLVVGYTF